MAPPSSAVGTADAATLGDGVALSAPTTAALAENTLIGIGLILISTLCFSLGDVTAKAMAATTPAIEVTWFRYIVFALLFVPRSVMTNGRNALSTKRPGLQLFRATSVVASSALFIMSLQYLQPAEATAINFISPVFITLLSIAFLAEKVGVHRMLATLLGFAGVLLIVQPGTDAFQWAAVYSIASAVLWAAAMVATRAMTREKSEVTLAWAGLVGSIGLGAVVPVSWHTPTAGELFFGCLTGIFACAGHWFVIRAYRYAPASLLAPFSYAQLIFAGALGYLVFGAVPGPATFAGGIVIVASGLYTAQRESAARAGRG
jgi:drug/metabolite transporter (DMT)-like permease